MDNIARSNAHCRCNCICPPTIYTPTILTSILGCKTVCNPQDLQVTAFQATVLQIHWILNVWLNRYQNKEYFVNNNNKKNTTFMNKSIYNASFIPWYCSDDSIVSTVSDFFKWHKKFCFISSLQKKNPSLCNDITSTSSQIKKKEKHKFLIICSLHLKKDK